MGYGFLVLSVSLYEVGFVVPAVVRHALTRLETLLATFAHRANAGQVPLIVSRPRLRRVVVPLTLAASVALAVACAWMFGWITHDAATRVVVLDGVPRINAKAFGSRARFRIGQWLETDAQSRARLEVPGVGGVAIEPRSRVRLTEASSTIYRLRLERGALRALISAPAGRFIVDTPSSVAVDLGCAYTLELDEGGGSLLRVSSGLVALSHDQREALIPAGFACASVGPTGGCTPYNVDASAVFQQTIRELDLVAGLIASDNGALARVLDQSRERDAVTLWHLVARTESPARDRVVARLAELVPPPDGVSREGAAAGDRAMLDLWWNSFGYGALEMWRAMSVQLPMANK
jgi:hypothetical protein